MFEAQVLQLLRQYLGEYVHGLSAEALKISVWQGDVVLKDLQLKAEALNSLKLPVTVKAGFLGSVTLKVPWNRLGKESVVVLLDRIFILAEPIQDDRISKESEKEKLVEAKRRRLEEAESAMLNAKDRKSGKAENSAEASSWLGSLIATIIGNLKISITNVHIRYEDSTSNPGKPFCAGITLSKLAAATIDENLKETFVISGALDKLHKSLQLERLAIYHDSNTSPWELGKSWRDTTPREWCKTFEPGISQDQSKESSSLKLKDEHQYLLRPINGVLNYYRQGKKEKREHTVALQNVSAVLNEVSLTISENQYCDGLKLLEGVSRYRRRIEFLHFRPWVSVSDNPRTWWVYACEAALKQQKKTWSHLSWGKVDLYCSLRRKYVQLYLETLQSRTDKKELREIEEEVDTEVLLLWRLLARAKAESLKSKEESINREEKAKGGWWGLRWKSAAPDNTASVVEVGKQKQERELGDFTKEEWAKINELLNYRDSEGLATHETPDSLQMSIDATIKESTVQVFGKEARILCGNFVALSVGVKLYPNTTECLLKLQSYGLSAPEGSLIESVKCKGDDEQALKACYIQHPLDSQLDWKVSATILPCYVTLWFASLERFMQFLKSGHAVSPDVATETAVALQNKLEQVRRRAQEQLKLALEEESRFSVDLELDAPKVRLPPHATLKTGISTQLVLDFGHFTLHTEKEARGSRQGNYGQGSLYSQCYIAGNDIAAYLVDGPFDWADIQQLLSLELGSASVRQEHLSYEGAPTVLPVLDPCRVFLLFEKLRIQHPAYPATHIALQVPQLGLHFSPGRYQRVTQLITEIDSLNGSSEKMEAADMKASWFPADQEGSMMMLIWKGLGNTVAEWQRCWAVLSGSYLYILETADSQTYQRCSSLHGKQVLDVPPSNIGGSEFVLAVCNQGMELQKGIESASTVIMKLADQQSKDSWQKALMSAVYRLSAPLSISLPEQLMDVAEEIDIRPSDYLEQPLFFISGALHELTVSIYAMAAGKERGKDGESLLRLQAGGAEVNVLQRQYDLMVGMNLRYLKIEDNLKSVETSSCQYIARSVINRNTKAPTLLAQDLPAKPDINIKDDEEIYNDALTDFGGSAHSSPGYSWNSSSGKLAQSNEEGPQDYKWDFLALGLEHFKLSPGDSLINKIFTDSHDDPKSFVSMQIVMRQLESPDYDGTDVQMTISMATLEFFCNRPTVVALIEFGTEISAVPDQQCEATHDDLVSSMDTEVAYESFAVKGLLGQGKSRTVFQLEMKMDSVRVFLNLEDGQQLAMLDQERFQMDLKVFPGSFGIESSLGNLKICDMTLGPHHQWGWMCDIRDPGCDSLVKLQFQSFNVDEEDYQGYDYSLGGRLSSVRIVFLYRFIQEVTAYFTALSAPHTQQLTRVVDKVGGIEKLVPQSDIDGLPALKLNVFLETPIIIMPGSSDNKDFMQLDLGALRISNSFEWHGGSKENDASIHLDILSAEISGINLVVGIDGVEGKSMIQEVQGLRVKVCRPLRDLFRRVPEVQVDVEVQILKAILSDKEYLVITGCASSNIAEEPHLPADFRTAASLGRSASTEGVIYASKGSDLKKLGSEEAKILRQNTAPWTTVRVTVEVQNAELELCNGLQRESALARLELQSLWLNYRSTSMQEVTVLVTLPRLSVLDLRSSTKPEMRLMIGSMAHTETNSISTSVEEPSRTDGFPVYGPRPPMLVMDAKLKQESQAYILRIQRLRLLVVLDFLLAVGEFFVPSLATVTGKGESSDSCEDPLIAQEHVRLITACHKQEAAVETFSFDRKLIADLPEIDEFIYDGCENILCLDISGSDMSCPAGSKPIIIIGAGKSVRFKNVKIKNGLELKDFVQLHSCSSYSVLSEDGVVLDGSSTSSCMEMASEGPLEKSVSTSIMVTSSSSNESLSGAPTNFILELQAVAPELTFYDSERISYGSLQRREKLIRLKMDLSLMYACREQDVWLRGHVKRFSIDGGSGLTVVEPMLVSMEYACVKEEKSLNMFASDLSIQLSFSLMRLLLCLHDDLMSTFQLGGDITHIKCSHFDRIWVNTECTYGQKITIWRPRTAPGFAILSDCVTSGEAPPSQVVMAIRNVYQRARKPLGFDLVSVLHDLKTSALSDEKTEKDMAKACFIWRPVAPAGYVGVGCVAKIGPLPPPLSVVHCIRYDLVTSASLNDCVLYAPSSLGGERSFSIWRVENAFGSIYAHQSVERPARSSIYDWRSVMYGVGESTARTNVGSIEPRSEAKHEVPKRHERRPSTPGVESIGGPAKPDRLMASTAQFERMWWDKGGDNRPIVSIWRPIPPPGYAIVGDQIIEGLEPPGYGIIVKDDASGRLAEPTRFLQCMHSPGRGVEQLYVWYPVAPAGFVTLGCVVSKEEKEPSHHVVRCVRADLVSEVNISKKSIWSVSRSDYSCSIWKVHNQANTFVARPDLKKPPDRYAHGLLETAQSRLEDNLRADIKIARFSVTILDDLGGLMTPLANVAVTSINLAANGRAESMNGVCVASMAASTFNAQLEVWEPLIEPFEGIFKYESHDSESGAAFKVGKRIRITTANITNVNITSANINVLVEAITSWRKQCELEQLALNKMELENDGFSDTSMSLISSALEEDDTEKLVLENKLGCTVFLLTSKLESRDCKVIEAGNSVQVHVPPPNFGDKVFAEGLKHSYQQTVIHISEARDLPVNDDGNGHEYFYSLHVASSKQSIQGQKSPGQSARSCCVRPLSVEQRGEKLVATVAWNEVFIFDLPNQGTASMDIRVSNQAANAGRGELIGVLSIPLGAESNQEAESASSQHWKLIQQSVLHGHRSSWPAGKEKIYHLQLPSDEHHKNSKEGPIGDRGYLVASIYSFTDKFKRQVEKDTNSLEHSDGFLIGLSLSGPWSSIPSVLPLGTAPIRVSYSYLALEVAMQERKKTATLRSLVMVSNETDNVLEVCVCPIYLIGSPDEVSPDKYAEPGVVEEEIFENQRYQPLIGWGSKWPGHFLPTDPGRWSSRDNKRSSQTWEDLEASLPAGWVWSTDWSVDKAGYVDDDGWAYGPDFQSLRWPPNTIKSCKKSPLDFVRRRRWCRSRKQVLNSNQVVGRQVIAMLPPGGTIPVPVNYTLSSQPEFCLQVRPYSGTTAPRFLWSRIVPCGTQSNREYNRSESQSSSRRSSRVDGSPVQPSVLKLNQLQKAEELLMCPPSSPSASRTAWWLSIESDANILYSEVNAPVCDWKFSVIAPLRIENLLPCDAEYALWEKQREGSPVQRDRGVAPAGGTIHAHSVDMRRQIYLTWFTQGGWKLEKEIVLLSDPTAEELPSSFSLINQQNGRKLQVSIERDFGMSNAASRTVRIFVPYWLWNQAALPLSYCLVEVEPAKGSDGDSPWLMRAVKAAKHASSRPSHSRGSNTSRIQRVVQHLDVLENTAGTPTMLSLQAQINRTGFIPFSPRPLVDGLLSPRLGISVCASHSNSFTYGISFKDLEDNERVIVKAMDESGAYYKLSVFLMMSSERTKVVNFQPHTLFVNRLGQPLYMRQCDLDCAELLYPNDPPKVFLWQSAANRELIKICLDGYEWSTPFTVDSEGTSHILLQNRQKKNKVLIKAEIRNGTTESRYLVIFRRVSFTNPYRVENLSLVFPIRIRQAGGSNESWQLLAPGSAVPFAWEDLQREHKVEIAVDGAEASKSRTFAIDDCTEYQPSLMEGAAIASFCVKTQREGSTQVVKVIDWMPSNKELPIVLYGSSTQIGSQQLQGLQQHHQDDIENQVHVVLELAELGVSLVDHTPEEILYLSMQNFILTYATGLGSGISRFKLRVDGLQLDNQLPLTPMPVLLRNQAPINPSDFVFKCTITLQDGHASNKYLYPYIGIQVPSMSNAAFLINIHEPLIWRLQQMYQSLNLSRLTASQTTDVSVDPIVSIGLLTTSEIRFKVSLAMSPTQRPRGALGFWASLITALGNTDDLQIRIAPRIHEDICMRQSSLLAACMSSIKRDILSHPLLLLSGLDILGNASSALGHMSRGVAALSMDKKFIQSRQKQDTKASVEGLGDGFREGAEAFGKGLFRGVTGILTKPLEGARSSGVEGFVQGVGRGIIGVAAQPVSGVLDLLSKTTEGANAVKTKIAAVITSEGVLLRHRLPRVIGADKVLRPYEQYKAQGQILLQLAEGGSLFGPMDIFKVRGKFAMTDAYEDHYNLPKGRTLIITHRRVILLHHPTSIIVQKKPDLLKDPCSVLWDVTWNDLKSVELSPGKKDAESGKLSRLILHLRSGPMDAHRADFKELVRIVKCNPGTDQGHQILDAIEQAKSFYGPDQLGGANRRAQKSTLKRPYSGPVVDPYFFERRGTGGSLSPGATFGALLENTI